MKQFLSIILRNQFNLFYRFGYSFIPEAQLIEFEGIINDETQNSIIKQFKTVTPFEYEEEYLILHLEKAPNNENKFVQFEINDIVAVYPLSQQAKSSIESKIDQRIRLEKPIFETILPTIETEIEIKEVEKAISALWTICKIEAPLEKYVTNIGLENILNGLKFRKRGTKANKIQNSNYWEYLIAYDYYQYFPEGIIRHFYQLGEIFSYYKGKSNGIEGTKIEQTLKNIGSGNFEEILQKFNENTLPQSFIVTMQEIGKGEFNPIVVSVLFLKWKADLSSQDIEITESSIFYKGEIAYIRKFPNEVKLALILLGAFFGFRKFYDNYYETLNLRFFKDFRAPKKQTENVKPQEKVDSILETDNSVKIVTEEAQINVKQDEATIEEKLVEATSVEEQPTEIIVETKNDISNTQLEDKIEEKLVDTTSVEEQPTEKIVETKSDISNTQLEDKIEEKLVEATSVEDQSTEKIVETKNDISNTQLEDKIEEKLVDTTSVEEQPTEIIVETQSDISYAQLDDKIEVVSDITIQSQKIIEQALSVQFEIKYVEIPKLIKQRTGITIDKDFAIKITEQMDNVEKSKIGKVKNPNGIKQKGKADSPLNE